MSAEENIALAVAKRFTPDFGDRLRPAVEGALARARGEESPFRSGVDPAQIMAFASFVVSVTSLAWTIHMGLWQQRQQQAQAAGDAAKLKEENAYLQGLLAARLKAEAPQVALAEPTPAGLLDAIAEETIAEASRREGRG